MDTSDVYTQIFQSLMPLIQIAIVLWAAETLLTMFIKEHRKSKKKKGSSVVSVGEIPA